jgi:outer membrane protein
MKSLLIALLLLSFSAPTFSAFVVAKVDIQKVLRSVKQGKKVRSKLKKSFDSKKKILDKEQAAIRKLQESYSKKKSLMDDKGKMNEERKIQEKIIALQQKSLGFQKEIQKMEGKMTKPILERLKVVIQDVSKKSKVDITFEASTAPVVYAKQEKDITNAVISAYDKKHPK